jgi:hypothetical protein
LKRVNKKKERRRKIGGEREEAEDRGDGREERGEWRLEKGEWREYRNCLLIMKPFQ